MFNIIFYSFIVMLASLVGVISIWKVVGEKIEKNLRFLVSFSAGVFLVVSLTLAGETIEHAEPAWVGLVWIAIGGAFLWFLFKLVPFFHHHHDECEGESGHHSHLDARRILVGDAIHNVGDGILLAVSFAVSSSLGMITAVSIFVHELVQEISEFFVLRESGYSTKKALALNFLVSSTILIGSLVGYFLLEKVETLEVALLGISAGAFIIVVLYDLIPHSVRSSRVTSNYLKHVVWFVGGVMVMGVVSLALGH